MKTKISLFAVGAMLLLSGCGMVGVEKNLTLEVNGSQGLPVSGNCMVMKADGTSSSQSFDRTIPFQVSYTGSILSCTIQNQYESGTVDAYILEDGVEVNNSSTSAQYGVVSVTN